MKILMLTPYLPFPLLSGGQTRSYNLIKHMAKKHDITLCSFIRTNDENQYVEFLKRFCRSIIVVKRRPAWTPINMLLAALTPYPFLVSLYISLTLRKILMKQLAEKDYDLIHAETFYVMPNIPRTNVPILLVEQTIEYRVYQHFVESFRFPIVKALLWIDVLKIRFWERYFWRRASRVVAMSEADALEMRKLVPNIHVNLVPNGVDIETFSPVRREPPTSPTILYIGNFKWLQNREAVDVLLSSIWPKIKAEIPSARLLIVGRGLAALKSRPDESITFDESVKDIRESYKSASVMLAPIRGPGGTRLKILEAMASGCPVVTTPVGIEGIDATPGKEVLVGHSVKELVQATVELLQNPSLQERLVQQAYALVKNKYNWKKIGEELDQIYQEVSYE